MTVDSDNSEIDLDYSSTTSADEGEYDVTVSVVLDDFSDISDSTTFKFTYLIYPDVAPTEMGAVPSTTLVIGKF